MIGFISTLVGIYGVYKLIQAIGDFFSGGYYYSDNRTESVRGYWRRDGTYVASYLRRPRDGK